MDSPRQSGAGMKFSIKSGTPEQQRSACVIAGVFEKRRLSDAAQRLDEASGGLLGEVVRRGDMDGKPGQVLLLPAVAGIAAQRVLLVGCGHERELADNSFRKIVRKAALTLNETGATEAASYLAEL
ncbi:MAG TPA: leucyl aminopeptidase, partial [Gammaproteobacteria bacterium]|nr:leucyl aminopeptidase [Gammaproteobacteria bacterium]